MTKITYENLQSWIEMLIDAIENRGASSSGIPNHDVFPYAEKYRQLLKQVRNKEISKYELEQNLSRYQDEVQSLSNQKYRTEMITAALNQYFHKEFMK